METCPYCAEQIPGNSETCPHCGSVINQQPAIPAQTGEKNHSTLGKISLMMPGFLLIVYIIYVFAFFPGMGVRDKILAERIFVFTTPFLFLIGAVISIVEIIRNLIKKKYRNIFPVIGLVIDIPAFIITFILLGVTASALSGGY